MVLLYLHLFTTLCIGFAKSVSGLNSKTGTAGDVRMTRPSGSHKFARFGPYGVQPDRNASVA